MRVRKLVVSATLLLLVGLLFPTAHAQYRASIRGVVTDPQGALVPGASVTLRNQETNQSLEATSDENGVYTFNALPPSRYSITVRAAGFKTKLLENVGLIAEQANALNVQLEVGQTTETVSVNADSVPLIDTETAMVSGTVTTRHIQSLPSFSRDVFQLAQLAPGTFGDGAQQQGGGSVMMPGFNIGGPSATDGIFKTENAPQIIANGTQGQANNITIDGVGVTSVSWGGSAVVTPNEESVKEVKVLSNSYDAEYGRYSGAQIQVISKNGTNNYHGSLFFKADRPGLNAFQRWNGPGNAVQRNEARYNQYGGSVTGPIWKDKLFGFFSYETIRNHSSTLTQGWYEAPQFLTQAPAGSIAERFLTFPGAGVAVNRILEAPGDQHTCADVGLIEGTNCSFIADQGLDVGSPLTSPLGTPDPGYVSNTEPGIGSGLDGVPDIAFVEAVAPTKVTEYQFNVRVDFNATSKDLVAFSMYRVPLHSESFNGPQRPMNFFHHDSTNEAETALWNHTFSPTLLNEARVNAAGWRWDELESNPQEPYGLPTDNIDPLGFAFLQNFGAQGLSIFNQWTYNFKDTLTKVHRSHTMKFGADLTRLLFMDRAPWSARPFYNFRNLWDFLNDAPYAEGGSFDPITGIPTDARKDTRANILGFFAQDSYKVRPNLTLTFGLRWEYFAPIHEKEGRLSTLVLGSGANPLDGMRFRQGGDLYEASKNNWGPQLGFAWSPRTFIGHDFSNKLVVRGGFGLGFNNMQEAITLNGRANPPLVASFFLQNSPGNTPVVYAVPDDVHQFSPYPANPNAVLEFDDNFIPISGPPISAVGFPASMPTTYTYRYSLDTEYDLGRSWVASLGYQGSTSHHFTRQYNLNVLYSPINPRVAGVDFFQNDGNANYNAILAGVRHQFSQSFSLDAQYRWSKSNDTGSTPYFSDAFPYNSAAAWGPSDYDVRHAFKLFGVWSPRIFTGDRAWLEKIAGGWTLSGILNWHTGFPWTPVYNDSTTCNIVYEGSCFQGGTSSGAENNWYRDLRPADYLGGAGDDYSNDTFMKTAGNFPNGGSAYFTFPNFTPAPDGSYPQTFPAPQAPGVGRNSFGGPRYLDVDMTLKKAFGLPKLKFLGEDAQFEMRADVFNLFNNLNLAIDQFHSIITGPFFGQPSKALGARTIELQARFSF